MACLVGWAQERPTEPTEPLELWARVVRATGVDPRRIDRLDVVYCQSWQYDDPAGRLAAVIGASPRVARYSGIGGTMPISLLGEATASIAAGVCDVAVVVGAEALDTVRRLKKAGDRPAWSHRDPERKPFPFEAPFHPAELAHQVFQAYTTFALRDIARRAARGIDPVAHRQALGELFAPMTEVAARNPYAWFPVERSSAELTEPRPDNRLVAYPYTKMLMSVMDVDLAAAVVLASDDAADAMGVPTDRRVHVGGWAYGEDPVYVAEHDDLSRSPTMAAVQSSALAGAGADLDDVAHLDLYSCFPSSVSFALDALGLSPGDERAPFTVTGGLPYAGGAGSCYVLHALATMADVLCDDPGSLGLVTGVGMHMTKHAAVVLSTTPPASPAGPSAAMPAVPRRPIVDVHHGPATVAAYTVHHGRDGVATDGLVVCDVDGDGGARCYGKVTDPDLLAEMEAEELVGRRVELADDGEGVNLVTTTRTTGSRP